MDEVIKIINRELVDLFKYPGVKIYGLAQSMVKETGDGTEIIPALVDREGEGKWVGVDDTAPLIAYHKVTGPMTSTRKPGYGDSDEIANLYSQALIVYFDRSRINLSPDQVQRFIQVRMPILIRSEKANFKSIRINVASVITNSQQVYQGEYQNGTFIDPGKSMLQINYQIESRFSKACLPNCP